MGKKKKKEIIRNIGSETSAAGRVREIREIPFIAQWLFFAVFSVVYIWLLRFIYEPSYLVNDNVAIIDFLKDGFLPPNFVHVFWAGLLSWLYALSPPTPWHGLSLYALQAVSISLVLTVFFRIISNIGFFCLFAFLLLFFWADMIVRLDYTGTSIIIGSSAVMLFLHFYYEGRMNVWPALLLGLLLVASMMPRLEGIQAVTTIAAPFIGFLGFLDIMKRRSLMSLFRMIMFFMWFFLPAILFYSANSFYRANFVSGEEAAYFKFQANLPIEIEHPKTPGFLVATGWTLADYIRLQNWTFFDENIYNFETFEKFYEEISREQKKTIGIGPVISSLIIVLKIGSSFFFLMAAGLVLAWVRRVYAFNAFIIYCLTVFIILGIGLLLELFLRFPYRIAYPMLFSASLFVFFLSIAQKTEKESIPDKISSVQEEKVSHLPVSIVLTIIVLSACAIQGVILKKHYEAVRLERLYGQVRLTQLINTHFPGSFLVVEPLLARFHLVDPIDPPEKKFTEIPLGWITFSPLFYHRLKQMGLERGSDLLPAMISREDILIFSRKPWIQLLVNYAEQREFKPNVAVLAHLGNVYLYRLREKSNL